MSRLPLQTIGSAPEASRPYLEKVLANNGFLPNLVASLANVPTALETYLTVAGINGRSSLTLAERETVQIMVAAIPRLRFLRRRIHGGCIEEGAIGCAGGRVDPRPAPD